MTGEGIMKPFVSGSNRHNATLPFLLYGGTLELPISM